MNKLTHGWHCISYANLYSEFFFFFPITKLCMVLSTLKSHDKGILIFLWPGKKNKSVSLFLFLYKKATFWPDNKIVLRLVTHVTLACRNSLPPGCLFQPWTCPPPLPTCLHTMQGSGEGSCPGRGGWTWAGSSTSTTLTATPAAARWPHLSSTWLIWDSFKFTF